MWQGLRFGVGVVEHEAFAVSGQIERRARVISWLSRAAMLAIHQPRAASSRQLGRERASELRFSRVALSQLEASRRAGMLELARRSCPHLDVESYLLPRFADYDYAIAIEAGSRLLAFELIQEFESAGERYVYLGPLFSREGACVPLFSAFFDSLFYDSSGVAFHLLTEAQNPRVALLFKRMFLRSSYPRLADGFIPERARQVAREFAQQLPHLGAVELTNLSTRSRQTLFRAPGEYAAVVDWMTRRGVHLAQGDSQLLVVTCEGSLAARAALRVEVWFGERALGAARGCKRRMLDRFERGAR
jgi:hypothetical protein